MVSAGFLVRAAFVVGAAFLFAAGAARGADAPRKYAVLSLVGDKITVVNQRWTVGSNIGNNERTELAIEASLLDDAATEAAGKTVMRLEPSSKAVVLAWRDPALFDLQESLLTPDDKAKQMHASLKGFLKQFNATHLLLITKHRSDAYFPTIYEFQAHGKLRGLGFFIDVITPLVIRETGKTGVGFLGTYAYVTVSLVDAETAAVLRHKTVRQTFVWSSARTGALNAWDGLTSKQKIDSLQSVVGDAVADGVAAVLNPQVR